MKFKSFAFLTENNFQQF